jgi:hypothetical protein
VFASRSEQAWLTNEISFLLMDEFRLAGASTNALRKGSAYYCPVKRANKVVHEIHPGKKLAEVSYMALFLNYFRMGSDKAGNEIIAVNVENGLVIQKYLLDVPLQGDWETMALGPCTCSGIKSCLYIGNMGDNLASDCDKKNCTTRRTLVNIYKLEEPKINAPYNGSAINVSTLVINYTGSNFPTNRANSEALFVVGFNYICILFLFRSM